VLCVLMLRTANPANSTNGRPGSMRSRARGSPRDARRPARASSSSGSAPSWSEGRAVPPSARRSGAVCRAAARRPAEDDAWTGACSAWHRARVAALRQRS
jgi:hypothetical protein